MVMASELRPGSAVRLDTRCWRVLSVDVHGGAGRGKGSVHARLEDLDSHAETDRRFRLDERVEEVEVRVRRMSYLCREDDACVFMDRETFEQVPIDGAMLGAYREFLDADVEVDVEFLGERVVGCRVPEIVEARVKETAAVQHSHESHVWKDAVLENGVKVNVPLFVAPGEVVRVDLRSMRYHDRGRK